MPAKKDLAKTAGKGAKSSTRLFMISNLDVEKLKELQKPEDQLTLTTKELEDEITKILVTQNPIKPDSLVNYSYATGYYEKVQDVGDAIVFFNMEGSLLERGTPKYIAQLVSQGVDPATIQEETLEDEHVDEEQDHEPTEDDAVEKKAAPPEDEGYAENLTEGGEEEEEDEAHGPEGGHADDEDEEIFVKPKKQMNMFNYCERASMTYVIIYRGGDGQTIPPPRASYSAQVHQWGIYDALQEDFDRQERLKEDKQKKKVKKHRKKDIDKQDIINRKMFIALNVLERMINQNTYNDIAQDYRFWDDPADEFKEDVGTLLPLWKFSYEKAKKMTVTDIRCSYWYYDLFGVSFGSFDFTNRLEEGYMCLFTVKNPSYPESICKTNSGVMCVDIHPNNPYFVVVGLYDGNVYVYNVQQTTSVPQFRSDPITQKHTDIVWEVQWAQDLDDGDLNFYSISGDGKVNQWVLLLNSFSMTTVMTLYTNLSPVPGPDGTFIKLLSCGSCLRLHPKNPLIYLVGTEEGYIYKCSPQYSFLHMVTYEAHDMPVYRIDYNKFNDNIFISCSGDWRIKIWEDGRTEPLFVFDLGTCVGDVRWAPYSSTVFAAVTNDGKVHVYDININKYKPMCVQNIVNFRRNKLTRIAFNRKLPIIYVGDDKGTVTSLKLSPNLRIAVKPTKKQSEMTQEELQLWKLEKILSLMREPKVLERPADAVDEE